MFRPSVFVSVTDLAPVLSRVKLFDARYDIQQPETYGIGEYRKAHAAGAMFASVDRDLSAPAGKAGRHPLPDPEAFVAWCLHSGIDHTPVVCYDDMGGGMGAARLWWMLDALGVEAYVLDGGFQAYLAAGLPTASGEPTPPTPSAQWPFERTFKKAVSLHEISPNARVVDARIELRFNSTVRPYTMDTVPGHIAGAVNVPFLSNLDAEKKLRPVETLRGQMSSAIGGTDATTHIFTCASGVTACMNIAVARHLQFGAPYLYCGAWSEYAGVHAVALRRAAVDAHGMCFEMLSKSLHLQPKVGASNCAITVDSVKTAFAAADEHVHKALSHMHVGEEARVFFRGGRMVHIKTEALS
jgi:thiosulfate/3-mercaptopyruvate sulfurtransferase